MKLSVVWKGPFRIIDRVSPWVFEIQDLMTPLKKIQVVHACRLKYYSDQYLNKDDILIESRVNQDLSDLKVESILAHTYDPKTKQYAFTVKWFGFNEIENTNEPASNLVMICPDILMDYITNLSSSQEKENLLHLLEQYNA